MKMIGRREFMQDAAVCGLVSPTVMYPLSPQEQRTSERRMVLGLSCGSIGIKATQTEAIDLAQQHAFEAVDANLADIASMSDGQLSALNARMKQTGVILGTAALPVDFKQDDAKFRAGMQGLPGIASRLQKLGVKGLTCWIKPCDNTLTYMRHFRQSSARLREVAQLLDSYGIRIGVENVGPKTFWSSMRYPFMHSLAELRELIADINHPNACFVLDSFHWYAGGDTTADLLPIRGEHIVAVHLNDAPRNVPRDEQKDNKRELPCATGVIDMAGFLNTLFRNGYRGLVVAEPFSEALNSMPRDQACGATAKAMQQALSLIQA